MGVIADLIVNVGANVEGFKKGMGEVDQKVESAGGGIGKLGAGILGVGAVAAVAVTGIVAFGLHAVDSAMNAGQAAYELSEKFGLLPARASEWLAVAGPLGLSGEQIGKGFQFLSKNVSAMQFTLDAGGKIAKTTAEPYKELGISVLDSAGKVKSADELMLESADAFKKMQDGPEKAALAMKLFGKSGTDLLPMLNQGRAGIEALMQQGKDLGVTMSGPQVEAAHKLFLEHQKLDEAMSGVTMQIGLFLMPLITQLMNFIIGKAVPAIHMMGDYFMTHLYPALQQVYSGFMQLIGPALKYIQSHFEDLKPVLMAIGIVFLVVLGVVVVAIGLVVLAIVGLVAGITWLSAQLRAHADQWAANVQNFIIGAIKNFLAFIGFFHDLPGKITQAAAGMWDGIWHGFLGMLNGIIRAWNGLHFTIGGGDFMGQQIPSHTFYVTQLPYFHQGGLVPGSGDMLAMLQGGERVLSRSEAAGYGGGREIHHHWHIENLIGDGPSIDMMFNKAAQRMSFAPGT